MNSGVQEYLPRTMDYVRLDIEIDGALNQLTLWDTYSGPDYMEERLRPLYYPGAHGFLICFALDDSGSLESVIEKWTPEINHHNDPSTPLFLIGCKKDIRDGWVDLSRTHVTTERGSQVARTIKAHMYVECSAHTGEGVREVFRDAMEAIKHYEIPPKRRRSVCIVA
jgi:Ras homolog gene family, member A